MSSREHAEAENIDFFNVHMLVIVEAELWSTGVHYILSCTYVCLNNKKMKSKHSSISRELTHGRYYQSKSNA